MLVATLVVAFAAAGAGPDTCEPIVDAARLHQVLPEETVTGASPACLKRVRNAVFASHGRAFDDHELVAFFAAKPWYRADPAFRDALLTPIDRANVALCKRAEQEHEAVQRAWQQGETVLVDEPITVDPQSGPLSRRIFAEPVLAGAGAGELGGRWDEETTLLCRDGARVPLRLTLHDASFIDDSVTARLDSDKRTARAAPCFAIAGSLLPRKGTRGPAPAVPSVDACKLWRTPGTNPSATCEAIAGDWNGDGQPDIVLAVHSHTAPDQRTWILVEISNGALRVTRELSRFTDP